MRISSFNPISTLVHLATTPVGKGLITGTTTGLVAYGAFQRFSSPGSSQNKEAEHATKENRIKALKVGALVGLIAYLYPICRPRAVSELAKVICS